MAWVYMLECCDGSLYVGSTTNIDARLHAHNEGRGSAYTRRRTPVRLVWTQETLYASEAFALEKQIQGWGRAKRLALIEGRFGDLPGLARGRMRPPE